MPCLHCLILRCPFCSRARIMLSGSIRDGKDQSALQDVNVVISSQGHKDITAYTISDQKGSFRLTYTPAKDKEYVIRFSYLGYETVVLNIEKSITQYKCSIACASHRHKRNHSEGSKNKIAR